MNETIRRIAENNGVTPEEVERDIKEAIEVAYKNRNATPESTALWDELSLDGKLPTVDKFIKFCNSII